MLAHYSQNKIELQQEIAQLVAPVHERLLQLLQQVYVSCMGSGTASPVVNITEIIKKIIAPIEKQSMQAFDVLMQVSETIPAPPNPDEISIDHLSPDIMAVIQNASDNFLAYMSEALFERFMGDARRWCDAAQLENDKLLDSAIIPVSYVPNMMPLFNGRPESSQVGEIVESVKKFSIEQILANRKRLVAAFTLLSIENYTVDNGALEIKAIEERTAPKEMTGDWLSKIHSAINAINELALKRISAYVARFDETVTKLKI